MTLKWAHFIFIRFIEWQSGLYMWRIPIIDDVLCQFVLQSVTFQLEPQLRETTDQRSLVAKFGHLNDVRTPAAYNVSIGVVPAHPEDSLPCIGQIHPNYP